MVKWCFENQITFSLLRNHFILHHHPSDEIVVNRSDEIMTGWDALFDIY